MSFWSYYFPHIQCAKCRSSIDKGERIFHCRADHRTLCSTCGQEEDAAIAVQHCDWCGGEADDREQLNGSPLFVYWCKKHAKVGIESSTQGQPASKGSLYGEMKRGKLGDAEEARA